MTSLRCRQVSARLNYVSELLYGGGFTQVFRAVRLAATGKAIKLRVARYFGYFIIQAVTSQHTEMAMMVGTAAAFGRGSHCDPLLARMSNVRKERYLNRIDEKRKYSGY